MKSVAHLSVEDAFRQLSRAHIRTLAKLASEKGLIPPALLSQAIDEMDDLTLDRVRMMLHEIVYAPPKRG